MKKTISQRFFLSLCLMIVGCLWGSAVWAAPGGVFYTLECLQGSNNAYANYEDVTINGLTWDAPGNQSLGGFWRIGGKSLTKVDRTITGKDAISSAISKVTLAHNGVSNTNAKINSVSLTVASDANFTNIIETVSFDSPSFSVGGTGTMDFAPEKSGIWPKDSYYKLTINITNSKDKNYGLDITSLTFYEGASGPTLTTSTNSISFGDIETGYNDTNTFSISGTNLTADATLEISGTDAAMFSVSPTTIYATDGKIAAKDVTVTYAPTATGEHFATLTISSGTLSKMVSLSGTGIAPQTHYTVSWKVNGATYTEGTPTTDVAEGEKVETLPTNPAAIGSNVFMGWTTSAISGTSAVAPGDLFTTADGAPVVTGNTTYYAVFAKKEGSEPTEKLNQTLAYDTWTYSGSTTDKSSYRLFHTDSYIESAAFDLSKLSKVIVYGGTFGGSSYNKLSIGDGTKIWKDVTVSGKSETGVNTYTDGTPLTGTGKLRVTSKSGTATSNGVRISKVEIFIMTGGYTYTDYATTIAAQPAANIHATTYYKQITSSDELADGGQYVIVYTAGEKGLLAGANNVHNATPADVVFNNGTITTANAAAMTEITFEKYSTNTYYLKIGDNKYIKATSGETDLNVTTGKDDNSPWVIAFDAAGNVEITSKKIDNRGIMYSTAGFFKNYSTKNRGQADYPAIQLYQKVGEMPIAKATGGITTYVADFAYVMPQHLTGHTVALADKQDIIITEKAFRAGSEVPAFTPLLIKSDEDYDAEENSRNYNPAVINKTVDAYAGKNMLEYRRTAANLTNTMKNESVYYYKLAIKNDKVGFYWGAADGAAFKMTKPSTAYLTVPQSKAVQGFVLNLEEGETTGIATVVTNEDAPIYNLQGIRMNGKNLPKGIYIQGGKKFMVK